MNRHAVEILRSERFLREDNRYCSLTAIGLASGVPPRALSMARWLARSGYLGVYVRESASVDRMPGHEVTRSVSRMRRMGGDCDDQAVGLLHAVARLRFDSLGLRFSPKGGYRHVAAVVDGVVVESIPKLRGRVSGSGPPGDVFDLDGCGQAN